MSFPKRVSKLIPIDSVGTTRSYDYTHPTLISPARYTARSPTTSKSFRETFNTHFPLFSDMNWGNLVVRGGAVVDMLLGRTPSDLDVFLYGCGSPQGFVERASEFLAYLLEVERRSVEEKNKAAAKAREEYKKSYGRDPYSGEEEPVAKIDIKVIRSGPVLTVFTATCKVPIQIVLTCYPSKEAVVEGADMAVCGASYDGHSVFVTEAGRWSLENLAIRVEEGLFPQARRLEKYFNKGFDIVLPGLDIGKLPRGYLALGLLDAFSTPCLTVAYSGIAKNKIAVSSFLKVESNPAAAAEDMGGYDKAGEGRMHYPNAPDSRTVLYKNIEMLAEACVAAAGGEGAAGSMGGGGGGSSSSSSSSSSSTPPPSDGASGGSHPPTVPDFSVFAEADHVGEALAPWPKLTSRQVENTYEGIRHHIYTGGTLNLDQYRQFVRVVPVQALLSKVAACPEAGNVTAAMGEAVAEAVEKQKAACNGQLPVLRAWFEGKLPPVLTPEETFKHRMVTDPKLFYGSFGKAEAAASEGEGEGEGEDST